jgi:hypothetical protein
MRLQPYGFYAAISALSLFILGCRNDLPVDMKSISFDRAGYSFVESLLDPNTGLAASREGECFTTVYKSSLAAMALIHQGNRVAAERIFEVFRKYHQTQGNNFRGFSQVWNSCTGLPDANSDRWEGDNAFLLLALNYYSQITGGFGNYNDLAQGLVSWLSQRANSCDQIFAEGIANMYAALIPFAHNSTIQSSLFRLRHCFFSKGQTSSVAYEHVLDHNVRGALVFGDTTGFKYLNNFARSETWAFDHSTKIAAYSAFAGESFINLEISAQLLLAWKVSQPDLQHDLSHLRVELEKLRLPGKSDPQSSGLPYFVTDRGFDRAYSLPIIDSTCYLVFYYWGFNPFAPGKKYAAYP